MNVKRSRSGRRRLRSVSWYFNLPAFAIKNQENHKEPEADQTVTRTGVGAAAFMFDLLLNSLPIS
jgi:hypothetical protein